MDKGRTDSTESTESTDKLALKRERERVAYRLKIARKLNSKI